MDAQYPNTLNPTEVEPISLPSGRIVEVPKTTPVFPKWEGEPIRNTFGGKPMVEANGQPMFAELAIRSRFVDAGWNSRWACTYGASKQGPKFLSRWADLRLAEQNPDPISDESIIDLLAKIYRAHDGFGGFWDVISWQGSNRVFAESKRTKKDRIQDTQRAWLASALSVGLSIESFLIVEWQFDS